jgi:heme/copper-type cytochrome/quinol oxidase subunit 1
LGLAGIPRRYADYPDIYRIWNVVASFGSMISCISSVFLVYVVWEAFVEKRPRLRVKRVTRAIEMVHSIPPINHSYNSVPLVHF